MDGQTMILLPLGLLPVYFFIAYILFDKGLEKGQKAIGGRFQKGITEYPHLLSRLFNSSTDELTYSDDGRSVILSISLGHTDYDGKEIRDAAGVMYIIEEYYSHYDQEYKYYDGICKKLVIENVTRDEAASKLRIKLTLPTEIIGSDEYIENEIARVGRVFNQNSPDSFYYLLYKPVLGRVEKKDCRTLVFVDRRQYIPSIFDTREAIMSEKQITRNIKNRLWNRFDVQCVSIDETVYCGEILSLPPDL